MMENATDQEKFLAGWTIKVLSANSFDDSPDDIKEEELTSADDVGDDPEEHNTDSKVYVEKERWTDVDIVKDGSEELSDDLEDDRNRARTEVHTA